MKYHINKKSVPAVCRATKRKCPFGGVSGNENHYSSLDEAQAFVDKENSGNFELLPSSGLSPSSHQKIKTQIIVTDRKVDKEKFIASFENNWRNKPAAGGFWTSTLDEDGSSDWMRWAKSEGFYEDSVLDTAVINISENANVLTIG